MAEELVIELIRRYDLKTKIIDIATHSLSAIAMIGDSDKKGASQELAVFALKAILEKLEEIEDENKKIPKEV